MAAQNTKPAARMPLSSADCEQWCNKWTISQTPCRGCTGCNDRTCYTPPAFPHGLDGESDATIDAAYGSAMTSRPGSIVIKTNSRAYVVSEHGRKYQRINMLGKTMRFTVDASRVPCSVNAALYFVQMQGVSPAGYCDIQTVPSCTEIDVFEAQPR